MFAMKDQFQGAVVRLLQRVQLNEKSRSNDPEEQASVVALALASQQTENQLNGEVLGTQNRLDECDNPLLSWDVNCEHTSLIRLLLSRKVTIEEQYPLAWALDRGNERIAQVLLRSGANIREINYHSHTVLCSTVISGRASIVQLLLDNGTQDVIDLRDAEGCSPLDFAARRGHIETIKILLKAGAQKDFTNNAGHTALIKAARKCREAAVTLLLEEGANPWLRTREGMDVTHFALVSENVVQSVLAKYHEQIHAAVAIPSEVQIRNYAMVMVEMTPDWANIWIDSYEAFIEPPESVSYSVKERCKKMIRIG